MNYIFKGFIVFDAPKVGVPQEDKTTLIIACTTGIEGDIYSFEKVDYFDAVVSNTQTIDEVLTDIRVQCEQFVIDTYPNT